MEIPQIFGDKKILLNNIWIKEEVSRENLKLLELNENEHAIYQNLMIQKKQ